LRVQACPGTGPIEHIDGALLQHARADAAEHVLGTALLEDHIGYAGTVQQLAQQQPCRSGSDDRDLRLHISPPARKDLSNCRASPCTNGPGAWTFFEPRALQSSRPAGTFAGGAPFPSASHEKQRPYAPHAQET